MKMPRWLRILATGSAFFWFGLLSIIMAQLYVPLMLLGAKTDRERARRVHRLLHWACPFFTGYMRKVGLLRFHIDDVEIPEGGALIIANHPSLIDVIYLIGMFPNLLFLAKAPWFRGLMLGRLLRAGDHIPGPDGDGPAAGVKVLDTMMQRLRDEHTIMIFPEGTRSPVGGLQPFKRGAFEAALRTGKPIVPLLITVNPPTLHKGLPWYRVPERRVTYRIRKLPLIDTRQWSGSARKLCRETRKIYERELGLEPDTEISQPHEPEQGAKAASGAA